MLKMWETFFFNFLELFFILVHVPLTNEQKQKKAVLDHDIEKSI